MEQENYFRKEKMSLPVGATVRNVNGDRYIIEKLLGKGGSGAVYLVQNKHNRQDYYALKELIDPDRLERDRFAFEAEVLMRLDHESLPHVYRVFENDRLKRVYILMDYIEGQDLEALRKEQPGQRFKLRFVLALLAPVVGAISYLHHREPPIVHRDIKPANIVVPVKGGDALLVDFGIAKEYINDGTTTVVRHGTPGYAALEQYGGGTNIRTDVYGLGATLYTLLTGSIPADALTRVTGSQGTDTLKLSHELEPSLPRGVSQAISRAMSLSREDRFSSVDEFWTEINAQATAANYTSGASDLLETEEKDLGSKKTKNLDQEDETTLKSMLAPARRTKKNISLMTLAEQREIAQKERRQRSILAVLAVFFVLLILGIGIAFLATHLPHSMTTKPNINTNSVVPSVSPTVDQSPYPTLSTHYGGTMHDYLNGNVVNSYLENIVQKKGIIEGYCNCLSLYSKFHGTVGIDGTITFTAPMPGRGTSILFEGHIKTGGDMAGQFYIVDSTSGQHTGEYGDWSFK